MLLKVAGGLGPSCISDLAFDAWRSGELDAQRTAALTQHLELCSSCRARRRDLDTAAEVIAQRSDFDATRARIRASLDRRRRTRAGLAGLAAAAAVALSTFLLAPELVPQGVEARRKGEPAIGYYVLRDGKLFRGQAGRALRPRDRLRFTWRSDRAEYLAILSLDARGVASTYYPASEAQAPLRPAGGEVELPAAVELDDTLGPETLFVLRCADAPQVEHLRTSLAQRRDLVAPPGCALQHVQLFKEPAP